VPGAGHVPLHLPALSGVWEEAVNVAQQWILAGLIIVCSVLAALVINWIERRR